MSGLDRAGYMAAAHVGESKLITSTMSSTSCPWSEGFSGLLVVSSRAAIAKITDAGMRGSSLVTSGTSWPTNAWIGGHAITYVKISTDSTGHKVIAYRKILL